MISIARLRQGWADLLASFWLRPSILVAAAILLAHVLIGLAGQGGPPDWATGWVYAGGVAGARDVLGVIAGSTIAVAGTVFSITVAALTLASNQMGPRLLRNFTRDPGNQYALGAFLATFAYTLVVLRSVRVAEEGAAFVPQVAVTAGLAFAFCCVGVLVWFLHHVATSINIEQVVALVAEDLSAMVAALPRREEEPDGGAATGEGPCRAPDGWEEAGMLRAPGSGYLRVLDDGAVADWAAEQDAVLELRVRPGDFVFPGSAVGRVLPAGKAAEAQAMLDGAMGFGSARSTEQDLEFAVRQLVEMALRALSPSINDPFTAMAVLDHLGAALCRLAERVLPDGTVRREGRLRLRRAAITYAGLLDAMFHMLRQAAAGQPAVMIRLLEVLGEVRAVERDPERRKALARHARMAAEAANAAIRDPSAREAIRLRREHAGAGPEAISPG